MGHGNFQNFCYLRPPIDQWYWVIGYHFICSYTVVLVALVDPLLSYMGHTYHVVHYCVDGQLILLTSHLSR